MIKTLRNTAAALALTAVCGAANAVPALQLGIVGGTYDAATQTIISSGPTFTLYAFMDGLSTTDTYALSMALSPMTGPHAASLGSFTVNGSTVNVTSGMTYGVPPVEAIAAQLADPGDLATHGVYPTYFKEEQFNTWSSNRASFCSGGNNTQDCPALTGLTFGSTGLYYRAFTIDVSGVHLKDPAFDAADSLGVARALAAAIKGLGADLVFTGQLGVGGDNAQVPGLIAELLDLPQVTMAVKLEVQDGRATVEREIEGAREVWQTSLPAVVSAQKGLNEPRYASLKGIMAAKKKTIETKDAAALGLSAEQLAPSTEVVAMELPPLADDSVVLDTMMRTQMMTARLLRERELGRAWAVIRPAVGTTTWADWQRFDELVAAGRRAALEFFGLPAPRAPKPAPGPPDSAAEREFPQAEPDGIEDPPVLADSKTEVVLPDDARRADDFEAARKEDRLCVRGPERRNLEDANEPRGELRQCNLGVDRDLRRLEVFVHELVDGSAERLPELFQT